MKNTKYFENIIIEEEMIARSWKKEITKTYEKDKHIEFLFENSIDIRKDSGGKPTKIVFSVGGPYVYLDLVERPGCIFVHTLDKEASCSLSYVITESILEKMEELYHA